MGRVVILSRCFAIFLEVVIPEIKCDRWSSLQIIFFGKNRLFIPSCGSTPLPKILFIIDKLKPVRQQLEVVFIIFRW